MCWLARGEDLCTHAIPATGAFTMSVKISKTRLIADRRREIEAQILVLQSELDDLTVAERVLNRLSEQASPIDETSPVTVKTSKPVIGKIKAIKKRDRKASNGTPKPEGSPAVLEMVTMILREAMKSGANSLSGRKIVDAVNKRYWPGVGDNNILPNLYRFVKDGRMKQMEDKSFALPDAQSSPQKEAPPTLPGVLQ